MVSELARRAGVPASTVRYYEQEGLLPARRSPSGYRLYDETARARLAFIAMAKDLGLPLPEIRRLLAPWEDGQCSDVQRELLPAVERRIVETQDRIGDLHDVALRLARARAQLQAAARGGRCDASCSVLGDDTAPVACTLGGDDREVRVRRWREALRAVTERTPMPGGVRLTVDAGSPGVGELVELAAAESRCCPFIDLTLRFGPPVVLEARAPDNALALVHELFGEFTSP